MLQGRQECRPSDGPATLLSPMVATKACFALKKQLLQVVGGPGKLFLPVGAKTCFGGWAARKHPLLSFGVKGWPCFFPSRPKSDFGAAADRGLDFQGDRIREGFKGRGIAGWG